MTQHKSHSQIHLQTHVMPHTTQILHKNSFTIHTQTQVSEVRRTQPSSAAAVCPLACCYEFAGPRSAAVHSIESLICCSAVRPWPLICCQVPSATDLLPTRTRSAFCYSKLPTRPEFHPFATEF